MAFHPPLTLLSCSLVACSVLTACAGPSAPSPTPSPTYQCVPEAGGDPVPCGPIEYEQAQARDALYAEAEAVYRKYWAESMSAERGEGDGIPPGIRGIISGKFLTYEETLWSKERRALRVGGNDPLLVRVDRLPGLTRDGSTVALLVCWDASQASYRSSAGEMEKGVISEQRVYLSRLDAVLKITNSEFREVDAC